MTDHFVTVGDDLALPPGVKVLAQHLPASGVPKAMVGLDKVDNTTDTAKPVSTAQQTALDGKVSKGSLMLSVMDYGAKGNGAANDTAAINAALAALVPGDTLYFPRGRYMTDGGHTLSTPSVKIVGPSGRAQTYNSSAQLYLRNGANKDMLTIAANQVTIRDLSLYGNYPGQAATSNGLVTSATTGANYILLDAVWVDSFNGDGFLFQSQATLSSTVVNCESRVNRGYGMNFTGTATDSMISNCYIDQNVQSGIFCSAGDVSFTSCHIWGNGTGSTGNLDGITFQSSSGCRVVNCYIETQQNGVGIRFKSGANKGHIVQGCDIWSNGYQGIYGYSAANVVVSGNIIRQNNYKGQTLAGGAGIAWDTCTAMSVTGNQFYSSGVNRQTYGYYEIGAANAACVFVGNMSRAADHTTGGFVLATGTASPTAAGFNGGGDNELAGTSQVILSPNGTRYKLTVGDDGALTTTAL